MKVNDILKLIDAGYTKADIEAMEAAPTPAQAEVPAKPAADPKQAQPAAEAQPAEAPANPVLEELKALREQMSKLSIAQGAAKIPDKDELMKTALEKLIGG